MHWRSLGGGSMGSKCPSHIWEDVDLDFFKIDEKVVGGGRGGFNKSVDICYLELPCDVKICLRYQMLDL